MKRLGLSTLSVVRFTDFVTQFSLYPSDESLGYYQSSANADGVPGGSCKALPKGNATPVLVVQSRAMGPDHRTFLRLFAAASLLILAFAMDAAAQPAGGKTSDTKPATTPPKSPAKPPAKSASKGATNARPSSNNGPSASLNGKWWTSGNDFGASEVVFTQNGASVSGVIHYADGRTGTITGTMVGKKLQNTWTNSSGESGSGWLELSWNNFLGGPWHNQRVRDGSWTLMRVEGKWCFGGSRDRIRTVTHNARGEVLSIAEDGTQTAGRIEGPWVYLESDGMTIKGDMDFRANRMNWSSGFFWTWCGRN